MTISVNRNEFVDRYLIKSRRKPNKAICGFILNNFLNPNSLNLDHIEWYKTRDEKIVIISSPYSEAIEDIQKYQQKGWIQINNCYYNQGRTFMLCLGWSSTLGMFKSINHL